MSFGMKNLPASFQRLIKKVIAALEGCEAYIDDMIIYSNTREEDLNIKFFERLSKRNADHQSFEKQVYSSADFKSSFKLVVDASDVAAGAVLLQEDDEGVEHPVCYF